MKKVTRLVGGFVAGTTLAVAAFGSAAGADTADDVQIIVENAPAAIEEIPPVLQAIADTYQATGNLNETAFTGLQASSNVVATLVQGTEQFGALPLGYLLTAGAALDFVRPYLAVIDDPAAADDVFYPEDLPIILGNVGDTADPLSENLTIAVIEGLQGNVTAGSGLFAGTGTPALVGNTFAGASSALNALFNGTTFNTNYSNIPLYFGVVGLVALSASSSYVQQAEDGLAPIFEALAPVTAPIIDALGG